VSALQLDQDSYVPLPDTTHHHKDSWQLAAYHVTTTEYDSVEQPISVPPLSAYSALATQDQEQHLAYDIFVRPIMVNNVPTIGHWDLGCTRSLIPLSLALTLSCEIDHQTTYALSTAGGTTTSLGTVTARLSLTPECEIEHTFIVVEATPITLIGGDILANIFNAVHFSKERRFLLQKDGDPVCVVGAEDPNPWPDHPLLGQPPTEETVHAYHVHDHLLASLQAYHTNIQASLEAKADDELTQMELNHRYEQYLLSELENNSEVFIAATAAVSTHPPCPTKQPWDFDVQLITPPARRAFSRPHNGDPVQTTFFARWLRGMSTSGAHPGAQWVNAISRAEGEVYYVAPARAIKKHDGDYSGPIETWDMRVIVDYREVNANSALPGRTSCPHISTLLNDIAQKRYKTKMDLRHGFFNVGIRNDKTRRCFAFSTPQGIFLPNVMPMGAKGSPDALMNMMGTIFNTLVAEGVMFVYLDDLVIGTDTVQEHWRIMKKVLALAKEFNLSFKRSKCEFLRLEIQFLGFTVAHNYIQPGRRITDAIQAIRIPTTKAETKSFVAMCNYFRCFIPDFARIAAPLTDMQRGLNTPFSWGPTQQAAFLALKQALSTYPVLRPFQFGLPTVTVSDASTEGAGAVLMQQATPDGPYHVCDFWSSRWADSIKKHSITELETRALVEPIDGPWRHYLKFQEFTAFTDHSACTYLLTKADKNLSKHDERSKVKLSGYALKTIQHVPGKHNEVADALSRLTNRYTCTILTLDAYAGCGTFLRALDQSLPLHVAIVYVAIEHDPVARLVIQNIVTRINTTRPGRIIPCTELPLELFPFQLGHDMNNLNIQHIAKIVSGYETSICSAGPPCQPFSPANTNRTSFDDPRSGFQTLHSLITTAAFRFWYIENVILEPHEETFVTDLFGHSPIRLQAADLGPAQRHRMVWANIALEQPTQYDKELYGFLWQDILQGDFEALRPKAPTLMASKNSYADRRGDTLVRNIHDGTRRRMTSSEREACIGLEHGDITTVINDYWDIHRLTGNAFPVPCQRHILRFAVRQILMTRPSHNELPHTVAFSVTDQSAVPLQLDIKAIAGRDLQYQKLLSTTTTDTTQYPHQCDGVIYQFENRMLIPNNVILTEKLMDHFHKLLGHAGAKKLIPTIKSNFYWKGMDSQITKFCASCLSCQMTKKGTLAAKTISTWTIDTGPWQSVHIDITMIYRGLPAESLSSAIVLVDRFTRYCVIIPCKHALNASELLHLLETNFFCHYGIPQRIISDNGPPFTAVVWDNVLELLGTRRGHTTVYRPQENGLVERMNRTIKSILATIVADLQIKGVDNIQSLLPWVMWSINVSHNSTLGMSPFEALTFSKPHIPHTFFNVKVDNPTDPQQIQFHRMTQLAQTWQHVTEKLHIWNSKIEKDHGSTEYFTPNIGDPVLVHKRRNGEPLNIDEADFAGPYPVIATFGNQALLGNIPNTKSGEATVHLDRVKPVKTRATHATQNEDGTWEYSRILFRDFTDIHSHSHPSLSVVWASGEITTELEQGPQGRTFRDHQTAQGLPPFFQKGITATNVDQVFQFQTKILQWKYPILVNTAPLAAASLTQATTRRKIPTPTLALLKWVVSLDDSIGLVIDYDAKDKDGTSWLIAWNDGYFTWHTDLFLQEHAYGALAEDKTKHLSKHLQREYHKLRGNNPLPLTTYLRHNNNSDLRKRRELSSQRTRRK